MKFLPLLILSGMGVAACGGPQVGFGSGSESVDLYGGAVSVRLLNSIDHSQDLRLEIVAREPGWIRIGYGPDGVSETIPVVEVPYRYQLRLVSEVVEGKAVIDRYVSPFFGKQAAEELQISSPGIREKKLVYMTMFLDSADAELESASGPIITPVPAPHGASIFSLTLRSKSGEIDGPVRIAGWLHAAQSGEGSDNVLWSMRGDMVRFEVNGKPVAVDGVSTVFRELTIEYSAEPLTGPPLHACAITNRRCPDPRLIPEG